MKIYIKSADDILDKQFLHDTCNELNSVGIDTTMHNYELFARDYGDDDWGDSYIVRFKCPGDYLAYFAMLGHQEVKTLPGLVEVIYDYAFSPRYKGCELLFEICGQSVESMKNYASSEWYGDSDDEVYYLKNLDTNTFLYGKDYDTADVDVY